MPRVAPWLLFELLVWMPAGDAVRCAEQEKANDPEEELLKKAGVKTTDEELLNFFRRRSLTDAERHHVETLIRQLGSRWYEERQKASKELTTLGSPTRVFLQSARKDADPEIEIRDIG